MENSDNTLTKDIHDEIVTEEVIETIDDSDVIEDEIEDDEIKQLREQLDKKTEEARKANFKIELEKKNNKKIEEIKTQLENTLNSKLENITQVIAEKLATSEKENEELRSLLQGKQNESIDVSSAPILETGKRPDGLDQSKINYYKAKIKPF